MPRSVPLPSLVRHDAPRDSPPTPARHLRRLRLTDEVDGFLKGKRHLIIDRDSKFSAQFKRILKDAGVKTVLTAWRAPSMSSLAERFVLSAKTECLNRMILFGEASLHRAISNYVSH